MNRNSNTYTFIYASVMVIIVAAVLSFAAISLKPNQKRNVEIEKKQNILASVKIETIPKTAEAIYAEKITAAYVINNKGELVDGVNAFEINLKKERSKKKIEDGTITSKGLQQMLADDLAAYQEFFNTKKK
jgi:Na+-transporting NADH:ubiquinone oxidoreductase subunit C